MAASSDASDGIAAAGVDGRTHGRLGEGSLGGFFAGGEGFVFEKSGGAQRIDQMLLQIADLQVAGELNQMIAEIEIAALAVEKFQALHQRGRNDQRRVGIMKRIADHQAGLDPQRAKGRSPDWGGGGEATSRIQESGARIEVAL